MNLRWIVLKILDATEFEGIFIHDAIAEYTKDDGLTKQDRSFVKRIVFGVMEHGIYIDYVINTFSKVKVNKMKPAIRHIMRLSVYQLLFMDGVPESAVCNEAVKLVKKRNMHQLTGFVNGVLRTIMRKKETILLPDKTKDMIGYLSVKYSFDKKLVAYLLRDFSKKNVEKFLRISNEEAPLTIRVNQKQTDVVSVVKDLQAGHITTSEAKWLPYALHISEFDTLTSIDGFRRGDFTVQDESSMLVGEAVKDIIDTMPKVNEPMMVLDICSAPGGKAMHIAELLGDKGRVKAFDVSDYKLSLINENITRLGYNNIDVLLGDGTLCNEAFVDSAQIVIADVPCSGFGIIRKKPDIKWHASIEKINELVQIQREILVNVSRYVKKGGSLIYSTCTITKDENENNVKWFLENHKDFKLEAMNGPYVNEQNGMVTLMPISGGPDGFFIAKLVKL